MNSNPFVVLSCAGTLLGATIAGAAQPVRIKPADIRPERELLITHPSVVDSPAAKYPGAWSFGTLIEELFGKEKAPDAARQWLESYYWDAEPGPGRALPTFADPAIRSMAFRVPGAATMMMSAKPAERIPSRSKIAEKVIIPWQARDKYDAASGKPWLPNLANAPFRLLAIVNRMDLGAPKLVKLENKLENQWKAAGREKDFERMKEFAANGRLFSNGFGRSFGVGYGGGGGGMDTTGADAGEGRLIFGAVDSNGRPLEGGWTIIFEYQLPLAQLAPGCARPPAGTDTSAPTREWAKAWHRLAEFELGDHRFNEELEQLTKRFTHRNGGPPLVAPVVAVAELIGPVQGAVPAAPPAARPPLAQLRSNEGAFGPGREFRQFRLGENHLAPDHLPMTPGPEFLENTREGGRLLSSFLQVVQPLVVAGVHTLPMTLDDRGKTRPLLATRATIPAGETGFHWEPTPRISRDARRIFSMNTCNGCHAGDTGCPDGLHVQPRAEGVASKLSNFMRMDGKANRIQDPGLKTTWVQQREMEDRAAILAALLEPKESRRLDALEDTLKDRLRRGH